MYLYIKCTKNINYFSVRNSSKKFAIKTGTGNFLISFQLILAVGTVFVFTIQNCVYKCWWDNLCTIYFLLKRDMVVSSGNKLINSSDETRDSLLMLLSDSIKGNWYKPCQIPFPSLSDKMVFPLSVTIAK